MQNLDCENVHNDGLFANPDIKAKRSFHIPTSVSFFRLIPKSNPQFVLRVVGQLDEEDCSGRSDSPM